MITYPWPKTRHFHKNYNENNPYPILDAILYPSVGPTFAPSINTNTTYAARRVAIVAKQGRSSKSSIDRLITQPTCPAPVYIDPFFYKSSLLFEEDSAKAGSVVSCQRAYIDGKNKAEANKIHCAKAEMHMWSLAENFPSENQLEGRIAMAKRRACMEEKLAGLEGNNEEIRLLEEMREAVWQSEG